MSGRMQDVSFTGGTAVFPAIDELPSQVCTLSIEDVELSVNLIESVKHGGETLVRFQVETIEKGAPQWHAWHQSPSH